MSPNTGSGPTTDNESAQASYTPRIQYRYPRMMMHSPIISTTRSHSVKRNKKPATYSRWTAEEDDLLRQAVALHGPHKWASIAAHVPNRTPMQCSTRWLGALNPHIHKGRWTEYEDNILKYSVLEYANYTDEEGKTQPVPWNKIAERIPNRTGIQCQARWTEALDPFVRKGKWSAEEDALLRAGVNNLGLSWIRIAETIPGRTQRQCRTRWMQIKYKEERQQRCMNEQRSGSVDDGSSTSCASTEEERDYGSAVGGMATSVNNGLPSTSGFVKPFFVVDDFDTNLVKREPMDNYPMNSFQQHPHHPSEMAFFKNDDLSFFTNPDFDASQQDHRFSFPK
ncbi:Homeodomain-like protein [Radiomyces spectabilis]|uniref:Homeodomain-like protein n=1 Tax=Radiomyces spectabilis TaxID=64574 RepID=UPI00221FB16D|nr:Homeodomain-like protein [Radiomyces spectabilis]KAI8376391.1 Homeodomain-like protein [Radiomyces spectabilis]